MRKPLLRFALVALLLPAAAWSAEEWRRVEGDAFVFTEVRPGIWHVQGGGEVTAGSHGALVENDADALLVDSHMTPAAARALVADLPRVTAKPLRYVVNTHFHFDHSHGNQVFGPEVEIVAHEWTRARLAAGDSRRGRAWQSFVADIPQRLTGLARQLETAAGDEERAELRGAMATLERVHRDSAEVEPRAATLALREAVTLYRGDREIRILHFGRGHTAGDVVVYLPAEKVLVAGDLVTGRVPYMGDGYLAEWADTLEHLAVLDVEVVLPGHGDAFEGTGRIRDSQALLRDLWRQLGALHAEGVPAADALARLDLAAHYRRFPSLLERGLHPHAVDRVYELLDE